jgi:hypothetical protein
MERRAKVEVLVLVGGTIASVVVVVMTSFIVMVGDWLDTILS